MAECFVPPLYELTPLSFAVQKTSFLPETGTLLSASQTIFAPRTGTPSSLRDTPSNRGNYPDRGITFQGRYYSLRRLCRHRDTAVPLCRFATIFAPRTGTPSSLRDTPSSRGNYPTLWGNRPSKREARNQPCRNQPKHKNQRPTTVGLLVGKE